jgi:WhiB family transcriptional regulator, redox-sensing transcriptional regulator
MDVVTPAEATTADTASTTTRNGVIDMSWRYRAACRTAEPDLFFPIGTGQAALDQLAEAKSICRGCPVVNECLAWALKTGQNSGVWGGMSEDERRWLQQNPRPSRRGARAVLLVKRQAPRSMGVGHLRPGPL